MKKLIIIFALLITSNCFAQFSPFEPPVTQTVNNYNVDTANLAHKGYDNNFSTIQTFNGITNSGANYQTNIRTVSTDDTLRANDNIVHIDASTQNVALETIPANTCAGLILKVKIIDVSNVGSINFNPDLESAGSYAFTVLNEIIQFYSDGTTWRVLSIYKP